MRFHWQRFFTLTFFIRVLAIISLGLSLFGSNAIPLVFAACTVSGTVYRDYNANGLQDAQEPGVPGITVTAYSETASVATASTIASGAYTLNVGSVPDGDEIRIEFSNLPPYLRTGPYGAESDTTVTFVTCTGVVPGVDLGTANPGQYCNTSNPTLGTTCFVPGDPQSPVVSNGPALVTFPYTAGGPPGAFDAPADTVEATAGEVGSVFGLAYQRSTNTYFMSAYLKRHVAFGPGGPGAIYALNRSTGAITTLATIPNVGTLPGRPVENNPGEGYLRDASAFAQVGRMSLGELDITEDDTRLYTVNLNTRALVRIIIASGAISSFTIPNPGCTNGQFRPFGVGIHDFQVYVGGVCDASGVGGTAADLEAIVFVFNPTTNSFNNTPVLRFPLNYPRRCADSAPGCMAGTRDADWQPWNDSWPAVGTVLVRPQPMLADIEFDNDNMILGLRDRFGDQTGNQAYRFDTASQTLYLGIPAGDILRACGSPQTGWTLESGANCGGVQTNGNNAPFNLEGPGNGEYYFEDRNDPNVDRHDEIAMGGIYQLPGSPDVTSVAFDPIPDDNFLFDAGVIWLNNAAGTRSRSYLIYDGSFGAQNVFGKANGLGSLEATCGPAPLEIGNRVWEDLDLNGRQDPNEMPFANVTLQLWMDTDGVGGVDTQVGETQTNAQGEYYFNYNAVAGTGTVFFDPTDTNTFYDIDGDGAWDPNEPAGILPNTTYEVRVVGGANYGPGGILSQYYATTLNTGTLSGGTVVQNGVRAKPLDQGVGAPATDRRDSDGVVPNSLQLVSTTNFPRAVVVTGEFGENDHTWDFGFALTPPRQQRTPQPGEGTPVGAAITKSVDPPFAMPGDTVTWTITVTNPNSFPLTNVVVTDTMPGEVEILSVSASAGDVTSDGQSVTWTQGTMAPGATVTINVVTRVRPNVAVPFNISNGATLTSTELPNPLFASANVLSVGELPGTGESPWSRWRLPVFALAGGLIALAGAWVWRRVRR